MDRLPVDVLQCVLGLVPFACCQEAFRLELVSTSFRAALAGPGPAPAALWKSFLTLHWDSPALTHSETRQVLSYRRVLAIRHNTVTQVLHNCMARELEIASSSKGLQFHTDTVEVLRIKLPALKYIASINRASYRTKHPDIPNAILLKLKEVAADPKNKLSITLLDSLTELVPGLFIEERMKESILTLEQLLRQNKSYMTPLQRLMASIGLVFPILEVLELSVNESEFLHKVICIILSGCSIDGSSWPEEVAELGIMPIVAELLLETPIEHRLFEDLLLLLGNIALETLQTQTEVVSTCPLSIVLLRLKKDLKVITSLRPKFFSNLIWYFNVFLETTIPFDQYGLLIDVLSLILNHSDLGVSQDAFRLLSKIALQAKSAQDVLQIHSKIPKDLNLSSPMSTFLLGDLLKTLGTRLIECSS